MKTNFNQAKDFVSRKRKDGRESLSGPGSHTVNTLESVDFINNTIRNYEIKSILDLGCGDWNWFKNINLCSSLYLGWDACDIMINKNTELYGCSSVKFDVKDIVTEVYPKVDLIICRDVLFHMTSDLSIKILNKIEKSCKYFITTNFNESKVNRPHRKGWGYYDININIDPFFFGKYLLDETEEKKISKILSRKRFINLYSFNDNT